MGGRIRKVPPTAHGSARNFCAVIRGAEGPSERQRKVGGCLNGSVCLWPNFKLTSNFEGSFVGSEHTKSTHHLLLHFFHLHTWT
jgi:hypothetical protein